MNWIPHSTTQSESCQCLGCKVFASFAIFSGSSRRREGRGGGREGAERKKAYDEKKGELVVEVHMVSWWAKEDDEESVE